MYPNNEIDCLEKMNLKKRPIDINHHYDYMQQYNVIFILMINGYAQIIRSEKKKYLKSYLE